MTEPNFAFGKKLGISPFVCGDINNLTRFINMLLVSMKETNKLHGTHCEFFRLDFRQQYLDEELMQSFPRESFVLDMKFGSKEELEEVQRDHVSK